jgi:hypothetical protein
MCSLPPTPTGTIGTPSFTEVGRTIEQGCEARTGSTGALGEQRHRIAAAQHGFEHAQRTPIRGAPLDRHRAELAEQPLPDRVAQQLLLGEEADPARGHERRERHVEDRAVCRRDDVGTRGRKLLGADDLGPEQGRNSHDDGARR